MIQGKRIEGSYVTLRYSTEYRETEDPQLGQLQLLTAIAIPGVIARSVFDNEGRLPEAIELTIFVPDETEKKDG